MTELVLTVLLVALPGLFLAGVAAGWGLRSVWQRAQQTRQEAGQREANTERKW